MRVMWRRKEFLEFVRFKKWAMRRRRVSELPAYLQPIGFGFSIVRDIYQGYLIDEGGNMYVGFIPSHSNFHYFPAWKGSYKSEPNELSPVEFVQGHYKFMAQAHKAHNK